MARLARAQGFLAGVNRVDRLGAACASSLAALEPEHQTDGIVVPMRCVASDPHAAAHRRLVKGSAFVLVVAL